MLNVLDRRRVGIGLGAFLVATIWFVRLRYFVDFRFDDAFMTLRYASNLVEHGVLSFNLDDRVDGYTSPGWTLCVSALLASGIPGEAGMQVASAVMGGLSLFAAWWLAVELGATLGWGLAIGALWPVSVVGFLVWAASGMETAFAALMPTVLLALSIRFERSRNRSRLCALSIAIVVCALSRPENALLAMLVWLAASMRVWRLELDRQTRAAVGSPLIAAALLLAGLFVWHLVYYGYPLPNTYYAKSGGDPLWARGFEELGRFMDDSHAWLGIVAALILLAGTRGMSRVVPALSYLIWFAAIVSQYARAGGDHMGFHRFYQPLVPVSGAFMAAAICRLLRVEWLVAPARAVWLQRGLAIAAGALVLWMSHDPVRTAWPSDRERMRSSSEMVERWRAAAETLARHFPPSTSMSIRAAGVIPYVTRFRSFDTLGLNNQFVAHHRSARGRVPGHRKEATARDVVSWKPDIIVNHPVLERGDRSNRPPRFFDAPEYRRAGYHYECLEVRRNEWICYWAR